MISYNFCGMCPWCDFKFDNADDIMRIFDIYQHFLENGPTHAILIVSPPTNTNHWHAHLIWKHKICLYFFIIIYRLMRKD